MADFFQALKDNKDLFSNQNINFSDINNCKEDLKSFNIQSDESEKKFLIKNNINNIYAPDSKTKPNTNDIQLSDINLIPKLLTEKDIIKFLNLEKISVKNEIKDIFYSFSNIKDNYVEKVKKELNIEKNKLKTISIKKIKNKEKIKLGRKRSSDESIRNHTKYSPDNLSNKIKNILKKNLNKFINNIISKIYKKKEINAILFNLELPKHKYSPLIKDIDYKSIANKINKNDNLELLNLSITEFLSLKISTRYKKINKDEKDLSNYNNIIIKYLLDNDDNHKDIFNFIFNKLKIEDCLNIFIHMKELNDFPSFNSLDSVNKKKIEDSLIRIEEVFNDLASEGNIYFYCFILLIYNYKRYYLIKQDRKCRKS